MITTTQIATILNKKHCDITKKVKTDKYFNNREYFIESTYVASNGRTYTEYIVTDLGCEQLSTRFRGTNKERFINEILTRTIDEVVPVEDETEQEITIEVEPVEENTIPEGNQLIHQLELDYKYSLKRKLKEYGYEFYNEDFTDGTFLELYKEVLEDFRQNIITQEYTDRMFDLEVDVNESLMTIEDIMPLVMI